MMALRRLAPVRRDVIPEPSIVDGDEAKPTSRNATSTRPAPGVDRVLLTISLTTAAGRSTTSPARLRAGPGWAGRLTIVHGASYQPDGRIVVGLSDHLDGRPAQPRPAAISGVALATERS